MNRGNIEAGRHLGIIPEHGEETVEDAQCRLQVHVDNILGACLWFGQPNILHQVKGKGHIVDHLIDILWRQVELMQWHKEATQQTHQQAQVDTVPEVRV